MCDETGAVMVLILGEANLGPIGVVKGAISEGGLMGLKVKLDELFPVVIIIERCVVVVGIDIF